MEGVNLNTIKMENIRNVFHVAASAKNVSRAEIAGKTGLSLMTIGKIADMLCAANIATQKKLSQENAGRRANRLALNPDNCSIILDLTSRDFTLSVMNICRQTVLQLSQRYNDDFFFAENLAFFLEDAADVVFQCPASRHYIGVCVLVPGLYQPETDRVTGSTFPDIENIAIRSYVERRFPELNLQIVSCFHAAASSAVFSMIESPQSKMILYWYLSETHSYSTIMYHNQILQGTGNADFLFENILLSRGRTLASVLRANLPMKEKSRAIARVLNNLLCILHPHEVILDCQLPLDSHLITEDIREILVQEFSVSADSIPTFRCIDQAEPPHAYCGATLLLMDQWLENLFLP